MTLTGAIFVAPFILFSSLGGIVADKWSKTSVIRLTRILQVGVMAFAWVCLLIKAVIPIYIALFLMATLSALFGPSKYGIIPDLVPDNKLLRANSFIAAFTFFGIIFGTFFASVLDTLAHKDFSVMILVCLFISLLGVIFSYFISHTPIENPRKKWTLFIYREIYTALVEMGKIPLMWAATFGYGYFLFIGAYVQMNIIPYSVEILHMDPHIGGYLFVLSAVGIGIGSLIASKMSGSLKVLPYAGLGISFGCLLFMWLPNPFWLSLFWLFILGFFGGLFLVPSQAFILAKSPPADRGRNFATANFFSFVFALLAAGVLFLFNGYFKFTPSESFVALSILNFVVCVGLFNSIQISRRKRKI
jgi:acyl-[acyl-carrier-protein]-phospholipid O-acyltransferase/long-chain-fatty-acid--[acyl-carrier-protein] ligase